VNYRGELLARDSERRKRIKGSPNQLLTLNEWHHPDIMQHQKPSETECFRSLADAIAMGNPSLYQPKEAPNTDWRNWSKGGNL
jgi:hypothetical protein